MPGTIAIGDVHGCSDALASILRSIDPQPDDTIITLGDYVDRGADSKGVLNMLIKLVGDCRLVPQNLDHYGSGQKLDVRLPARGILTGTPRNSYSMKDATLGSAFGLFIRKLLKNDALL
jgi:serine/threonine protein phosphatase 1